MKRVFIVCALVACGGGSADGPLPDGSTNDAGSPDAQPGCSVVVNFEPTPQYAFPGSRVTARAMVFNAPGVLSYTWTIKRGAVVIDPNDVLAAAPDGSAVSFDTSIAESYSAQVVIGGVTLGSCPSTPFFTNVGVPNANTTQLRVRVYPPANVSAPPSERLVLINGGANASLGTLTVDPGVVANGSANVAAYLRFIPIVARDAYVETFSAGGGAFNVRVLNQSHDVLAVPTVGGIAPRLFTNWLPGTNLPLDAGMPINGTVAGVPGAQVQMVIGGVPTTLTTADGSGNFQVRTSVMSGPATIEVTPPANTGLPRLVASATNFNFSANVDVAYAAFTIRNLVNVPVQRNTASLMGARVAIVGTIPNAGTIQGVTASGEFRAFATTNGSGNLPALLAPNALLTAVTSPSIGDFAVGACDLRAGIPSAINAPPMTAVQTQLRNESGTPLPGAILEAVPNRDLAMAGMGTVRAVADGNGTVNTAFWSGTYDLHLHDPQGSAPSHMAAPHPVVEVTNSLSPFYTLPKALKITGSLTLGGNPQPVGNASVQILCQSGAACVGTARAIPLADSASTTAGAFDVPILDPGTM